jgi:hypothetical protein
MEHGLPLSTGLESLHRWITTLPKRGIDPMVAGFIFWEAHLRRIPWKYVVTGGRVPALVSAIGSDQLRRLPPPMAPERFIVGRGSL